MDERFEKYSNRNRNINRGYRKLEVWKEAIELYRFVKSILANIKSISFKVHAQIEDSALSISSNIAEGYCRRYIKENIQFLNISLSSMGENYSQVFAFMNANIIDDKIFKEYDDLHYKLENKLIKLNRSYIEKLKSNEEWENDYKIKELLTGYSSDST